MVAFVTAELNPIYEQESQIINNLFKNYDTSIPPVLQNPPGTSPKKIVLTTRLFISNLTKSK